VYHDRDGRCPRRCVRADELEAAVWQHVKGLLEDPAALLAQFEAFVREADAQKTSDRAEEQKWEGQLRRLDREEQRLVDAYQAEVIDLAELKERREQIATRRQALAGQREQLARLRDRRRAAQEVWADLRSFCERVRGRLEGATLAERQQLLQLLIERVIVGEDTLEIRHVIPLGRPKPEVLAAALPDGPPEGSGLDEPPLGGEAERLCSDGVCCTVLIVWDPGCGPGCRGRYRTTLPGGQCPALPCGPVLLVQGRDRGVAQSEWRCRSPAQGAQVGIAEALAALVGRQRGPQEEGSAAAGRRPLRCRPVAATKTPLASSAPKRSFATLPQPSAGVLG
jgi:hypothetical protein